MLYPVLVIDHRVECVLQCLLILYRSFGTASANSVDSTELAEAVPNALR